MTRRIGLMIFSTVLLVAWSSQVGFAAEKKEAKTEKTPAAEKSGKVEKAKTQEKGELVTEGEFSKWLVQVLGLSRYLPAAPSDHECFEILLQNGIKPRDGWNSTNVVTMGNLARVVVQSMGKESEVQNPDKDESWIQYLKSQGIQFGTIGEAVDNLAPINALAPDAIVVSTDPLGKQHKIRPLDEEQFGADLSSITRPVTQREIEQVIVTPPPPQPPPMTKH